MEREAAGRVKTMAEEDTCVVPESSVLRRLRAETHRTVLREVRPRLRGDCRSAACQLSFGNRNSAACRLFGDRRRAAGRLFFDSQSAAGRLSCDRRSAMGSLSYFTSYGYCGICPARHECCLLHSLTVSDGKRARRSVRRSGAVTCLLPGARPWCWGRRLARPRDTPRSLCLLPVAGPTLT